MKRKVLILSFIIVLIISAVSVPVKAASYSFTVTMTARNTKVTSGSEVLITVKLSNLNVGSSGISSFSAFLSYDTDVFEQLTDSSIDGMNGWVPTYNTGTGKISLVRKTALTTDEEIMQISLKTKEGLADGTQGEIKLSSPLVGNSVDEVMSSPVSTQITIGSATAGDPVSTNTVTPINTVNTNSVVINPTINTVSRPANTTITPNNTANVLTPVNESNQNSIVVANQTDDDIPYTGTDSEALIRIIIGVIFISLAIYIKIERMNKDIK